MGPECESCLVRILCFRVSYKTAVQVSARIKVLSQDIDAFELWCWRRLLRVLWTVRRSNLSILKKSTLNTDRKDWCWSWSSSSHLMWTGGCSTCSTCSNVPPVPMNFSSLEKFLMLEKIKRRRRRGWKRMNHWMASPMQWTWTWANSRRWQGTGRPGMWQSMGSQSQTRLGNWTTTQDMTGEGSPSRLTYMAVGRIQCFVGCWPEAAPSALPCWPSQHNCLLHQNQGERVCQQDRFSLIFEMISQLCCHILWFRSH